MTTSLRYVVSIPDARRRRIRVDMTIHGLADRSTLELRMPVWTPGSYKIREYSRNVESLQAHSDDGQRLRVEKLNKASWQVDCQSASSVVVSWEVYGWSLNVRAVIVDDDFIFANAASLFLYVADELDRKVELIVEAPDGFHVHTGLERMVREKNIFQADDLDTFLDAPLFLTRSSPILFKVRGVPHEWVFDRDVPGLSMERLIEDTTRIVEANADVFDGALPYERYVFMCMVSEKDYGGLEHKNSTALIFPEKNFIKNPPLEGPPYKDDGWLDFLSLVAHEHFHVWNVKRIRPAVLGPFDYQRENYTRDLWTIEGVTSYYNWLTLLRPGLMSPQTFLARVAKAYENLCQTPGRALQSLEQASFDTWIKLYLPDEHSPNRTVSYYLKGWLVSMMLDLQIRDRTAGRKSLDDVMLYLHEHFSGERGFEEGAWESIIEEVTGVNPSDFFDRYIRGKDDITLKDTFASMGLALEKKEAEKRCFIGAIGNGPVIKTVLDNGPMQAAGVAPADELVAVNGRKISKMEDLEDLAPDDPALLHLFRRGQLIERTLVPRAPVAGVTIRKMAELQERHTKLLVDWLGSDDIEVQES